MEGETPPPLDISRRFRTEKKTEQITTKRFSNQREKHSRRAVRCQNGSKSEARRCWTVIKLSCVHNTNPLGLQMEQAPYKTHTHIHTQSENGCRERGEGGREGGLLGACRVRLNPFTAWWWVKRLYSVEQCKNQGLSQDFSFRWAKPILGGP